MLEQELKIYQDRKKKIDAKIKKIKALIKEQKLEQEDASSKSSNKEDK
jgi:hypothetical protein